MTSQNGSSGTPRPPRLPAALVLLAAVCVLLSASQAGATDAAPTILQAKLAPADGAEGDGFGDAVSIDGDTAIIGSPGDDEKGTNSGSVYVYTREGSVWSRQSKLLPADGNELDIFGLAVSVSGDTAIIGSRWDDDLGTNSGSAYVYVRNGTAWTQQAKLLAADGAAYDYFGNAVSVDGDTVVIGSNGDDEVGDIPWDSFGLGLDHGSAYVFTRTGSAWTQQAKLVVDDADGKQFGLSVSVHGDTTVIGSPGDRPYLGPRGLDPGSAYVFARTDDAWTQQAKLAADDGGPGHWFGSSVSVSGDTAIIGSNFDDGEGVESGSAYVFTRTGSAWTQQAKLVPGDGAEGDVFGGAVSIDGGTAIIGSSWDDDRGRNSGSAYVYARNGTIWTHHAKLVPEVGPGDDFFGGSVSVSGDTALIGSWGDNDGGTRTGSAYVYTPDAVADGGVLHAADDCPADQDEDRSENDAARLDGDCDAPGEGAAPAGESDHEIPGVGVVWLLVVAFVFAGVRRAA